MNNYALNKPKDQPQKPSIWGALKTLFPVIKSEKKNLILASIALIINSALNLIGPMIMGYTIDAYIIQTQNYQRVLMYSGILLATYLIALVSHYFQTLFMGRVGQHTLFNLRNKLFNTIQSLPLAFFNQNKAGDLISRINNDTDKLNMFFSQSLVQFVANLMSMIGAGIFLISLHGRLGLASLVPAFILLVFTRIISPWIKSKNAKNLKSIGGMSAEISENLDNFKVIVAFNRRDYFRKKLQTANQDSYQKAIKAGIANNTLTPLYGLFSSLAQLIVITYGIYLISIGDFSLGLLISFLTYISRFYDPMRQMAAIWSSFQTAMAGWDRIYDILSLKSNLNTIEDTKEHSHNSLLGMQDVSFAYPDGKEVLHHIHFDLKPGKTYALVGPTGGGKTTTASLMARLYDPTEGSILLHGKDIRSYTPDELAKKIGFILQEPFLFTGTVAENILYGNEEYKDIDHAKLQERITQEGLGSLLARFEAGLETEISAQGGGLSLGQKQLIAFMRAVLRKPELLILDEATANIDTVTEQLLEDILQKLPKSTTKVIIAHRLNTIENADQIFFVNAGEVILAGSMEEAVSMLLHGKRKS